MSSFFSRRSAGVSLADCFPDSLPDPDLFSCPFLIPILPPIPIWQCGDSGTVRDGVFVLPECSCGVEFFCRASHGV